MPYRSNAGWSFPEVRHRIYRQPVPLMADGSSGLDEWFTHGDSISASDCRPSRVHFMVAVPEYSRPWPGPATAAPVGTSRPETSKSHPANRHRKRTSVVSGAVMEAQLETCWRPLIRGLELSPLSYAS